jgi:hypothetical protein
MKPGIRTYQRERRTDGWCHGEAASESGIRCQLQGWLGGWVTHAARTMHAPASQPAFAPFYFFPFLFPSCKIRVCLV